MDLVKNMKKLLLFVVALSLFAQSTKNYATMYVSSDVSGIQPGISKYLSTRFNNAIVTYPTLPGFTSTTNGPGWYAYTESACMVPNDAAVGGSMYDMRDNVTEPNSYVTESMMLHHSVDFAYKNSSGALVDLYVSSDKFDFFEYNSAGVNVNGVYTTTNNTTFTDVTATSYTGASITIPASPGGLYVGYLEPFDQMNFVVTSARAGGSTAYNYWNGTAWTALTTQSDSTTGLTTTGKVYFYPPSDWARKVVNGSKSKYWVQVVVAGATTQPVYGTVKGVDWSTIASTGYNSAGWSTTDSNRINTGTVLEYNPTPPVTQTAHFQYQAWTPCTGYNMYFYHNDSYMSGAVRPWEKWLSHKAQTNYCVADGQCTGLMFDDAGNLPGNASGVNGGNAQITYLDFNQSSTLQLERLAMLAQTRTDLHTNIGASFNVACNLTSSVLSQSCDTAYVESFRYNTWSDAAAVGLNETGGPAGHGYDVYGYPDPQGYGYATYDSFLPANNPNGTYGYIVWYDYTAGGFGPASPYTTYHPWDRGQRGPMAALASHYIGMNQNTGFVYLNGGFYYGESDEVFVYQPGTTLAASIGPVAAGSNTIQLTSSAGCTTGTNAAIVLLTGKSSAGGEAITGTVSGNNITTTAAINNTHTIGDSAYCVTMQHLAQLSAPPATANVYRWSQWFPARAINIGVPDPNGMNGGVRIKPWLSGGSPNYISGQTHAACDASGLCPNVLRRDFTFAIVLFREYQYGMIESEWETQSQTISLGGTYYPLLTDGTTGPGVTSITLRAAEGVILMKFPILSYTIVGDKGVKGVGMGMGGGIR